MKINEHPKFQEEEQHLRKTILSLDNEMEKSLSTSRGEYLWESPGSFLVKTKASYDRAQKCRHALNDLYFGRVNWKPDGEDEDAFYIGKTEIHPYIIAWQDTLAADLYYTRSTEREKGVLQLVRKLLIENQKILLIEDQFKDPSQTGELEPDSMLAKILQENRGQLHEIIATINAQQYRIIRSDLNSTMIIQGAPGSGKTVIALHRISFLLYNYKELRNQNVVVLGPNPIFMQYVSKVLPSLGDRQIPQKTFDQWAQEQLGTNINCQSQDELLEFLLLPENSEAEKIMYLRNCRNMGSLDMGKVLKGYIDLLQDEVLAGKGPLICAYQYPLSQNKKQPIIIEKSLEEIQSVLNGVNHLPFNLQRDTAKLQLTKTISLEIVSKLGSSFQSQEKMFSLVAEQVNEFVEDYFSDWQSLNVLVAFRKLFRQRDLIQKLGAAYFSRWDLELMAIDAPTSKTPFRFSDLAGLLYFNILLNGTREKVYGHVVIDEAQDIPVLFFEGLSKFIPNKSMTILGDMNQGIYINSGLTSWKDLHSIFPGLSEKAEELNICYRSTWQIMQNANDLLRRIGYQEDQLIKPLNRSGEEVSFYSGSSREQLIDQVIKCIYSNLDKNWISVAVICKTVQSCRILAKDLKEKNFNAFELIDDRNISYSGGVVIMPSYLTKGLEFDAVILADGHNYPSDKLSARLLFVAITRAAHKLDVCWENEISPLLNREINQVVLDPFIDERDAEMLTVEQYANKQRVNAEWCIEQISRTNRLPLLINGKIDSVVMDMILKNTKNSPKLTSESVQLTPLDPEVVEKISLAVRKWENEETENIKSALALIQTIFGLLKNQMQNHGLISVRNSGFSLLEQILCMVSFNKLLEDADLLLPGGRKIGHKRLLEDVNPDLQEEHQHILQILIDYGLVESQITIDKRILLRISPEWIKPLLAYCLGSASDELDSDLVEELPNVPEAVHMQSLLDVNHD